MFGITLPAANIFSDVTVHAPSSAPAPERPVTGDDRPDGGSLTGEGPGFAIVNDASPEAATAAARDPTAEGLHIAGWCLKARRLREEMFGSRLFADPAWDILLDLYTAEARGECVQTSSLAFAARVPHSTAIRWAKIMTRAGLIDRHKDPRDARRIHVRLSATARALMEEYMARLCQNGRVPPPILPPPSK